ncbi:MAG: HAMP domain-containing histidine kinase [Melioribacteraceae bacterium]|nr:HAMP domain-containing histidine kinase [Melioribacteraceae bacterium]
MTPKQKTYSLLFLIALLVSTVLYNFVLLKQLPKLSFSVTKNQPFRSPEEKQTYLFRDLNKDGIDEKVKLKTRYEDKSTFSIVVYTLPENPIVQFNFKCSNMTIDWIAFADVVGDSTEEIIPFYEKNDTIFCAIADISESKFVEKDIFVLAKPETIYSDTWNPLIHILGVKQNKLSEQEVIIAIQTDYAQVPRGLFAFNLTTMEVTKSFFIGASVSYGCTSFFDLNGDGIDEIVLSTSATMNNGSLPKLPHFNDLKSWLIVLDNNFDTLFTKSINKPFSSIVSDYLIGEKENFLISKFWDGEESHILKISSNGEIVKKYSIKERNISFIQNFHYKNSKNILIKGKDALYKFDFDLNLLSKVEFKGRIIECYSVNIDSDKENEFILWQENVIEILDDDLSLILTLDNKVSYNPSLMKIVHTKTNNGFVFYLNSSERVFQFILVPNPLYDFRYLFFIGILIATYLLGLILHFILNQIFVFIHLLDNSTQESRIGIIILNPNKQVSFGNKSVKYLLSSTDIKISKKSDLVKAIKKEVVFTNTITKALKEKIDLKEEFILTNGKIVAVNIIPIKTPLNLLLALYIQIDDLTDSLLNDRAKTLAHSIQKVAHEIKTPLSSVLLSLDSLEQNLSSSDNKQSTDDDFTVARKEIDRIKKFINGFLKFANMSGIQLQECNLKEIIENSLLRFSTYLSSGIEIVINVDEKIVVTVDSYQIEEVFQVFIENSIDAMHGKGKIEIIAIKNENENINISIKDYGNGISDEKLPTIFQPYMTTKKDGTGMGLAIAKKILEDHGSKLKVKSKLGKGTEFRFELNKSLS